MISVSSPVQNSQMLNIVHFTSRSLCQVLYTCNIYLTFMMKKFRSWAEKNKRKINVVEPSVKHLIQPCKVPQSWSKRFLSLYFWSPFEAREITASDSMAFLWVL